MTEKYRAEIRTSAGFLVKGTDAKGETRFLGPSDIGGLWCAPGPSGLNDKLDIQFFEKLSEAKEALQGDIFVEGIVDADIHPVEARIYLKPVDAEDVAAWEEQVELIKSLDEDPVKTALDVNVRETFKQQALAAWSLRKECGLIRTLFRNAHWNSDPEHKYVYKFFGNTVFFQEFSGSWKVLNEIPVKPRDYPRVLDVPEKNVGIPWSKGFSASFEEDLSGLSWLFKRAGYALANGVDTVHLGSVYLKVSPEPVAEHKL